jgi:hypothetical protein
MGRCLRERICRSLLACLALVTVFSLFLLTTVNVHANPVTLDDQAGVLNVGSGQVLNAEGCSDTIDNEAGVLNEERVLTELAKLDYCIFICATDRFTGDQDALNTYTRERLPDQHAIAIGIDTVHRNLSIEAGTDVPLANDQASDAVSAFQSNYNGGNYTGATIAALDSLQNAFGADETLGVIIFIIGMVLVVLAVIFIIRAYAGEAVVMAPHEVAAGVVYGFGSPPQAIIRVEFIVVTQVAASVEIVAVVAQVATSNWISELGYVRGPVHPLPVTSLFPKRLFDSTLSQVCF